jgi:hypothetical protein
MNPLARLLLAHEQTTGHRERRSSNGVRITCAVCGGNSYKGAVAEAANGSLLAHFFCGHTVQENLAAMGLQMADLFQRRDLRTLSDSERRQLHQSLVVSKAQAAMTVLSKEANVLLIAANKLSDGEPLTPDELTRMRVAALKVFDAQEVLCAR